MRIKILTFFLASLFMTPQELSAQDTYKGYTILSQFTQQGRDEWIRIVQEKMDSGYIFYVNSQPVNDWTASHIVDVLGSYYTYVYGPAKHEVPVYNGAPRCVYIFNYDSRTGTVGSGTPVCGNF